MSDTTRDDVSARLREAAAEGIITPPSAEVSAPSQALAFLVAQVDGTILGRRLTFEFAPGGRLACTVAGRRLIQVVPEGAELPEPLVDAVLDPGQEDHGAALRDVLGVLARDCARVSVTSAPQDTSALGPAGFSAAALRDVLGIDPPASRAANDNPLAGFAETHADDLICTVELTETTMDYIAGDPEQLEYMADLVQAEADELAAVLGEDAVLILGAEAQADQVLVLGALAGRQFAALARPGIETRIGKATFD